MVGRFIWGRSAVKPGDFSSLKWRWIAANLRYRLSLSRVKFVVYPQNPLIFNNSLHTTFPSKLTSITFPQKWHKFSQKRETFSINFSPIKMIKRQKSPWLNNIWKNYFFPSPLSKHISNSIQHSNSFPKISSLNWWDETNPFNNEKKYCKQTNWMSILFCCSLVYQLLLYFAFFAFFLWIQYPFWKQCIYMCPLAIHSFFFTLWNEDTYGKKYSKRTRGWVPLPFRKKLLQTNKN